MSDTVNRELRHLGISLSRPVLAIIAIIAGILIIIFPDLLEWIVGIYLILHGLLTLYGYTRAKRG